MAKKSAIQKNLKRIELVSKFKQKRDELSSIISSKETSMEDRFQAVLKLASLPRNGSKTRIRNRCEISGRPRGYYRKFRMSRIALRDLASFGLLPGTRKASW
jgi:small subunit ribosomal protein S14